MMSEMVIAYVFVALSGTLLGLCIGILIGGYGF